jgi:hypothetical protein
VSAKEHESASPRPVLKKGVLGVKRRRYEHDFVNAWRDSKVEQYGKYLWLQFDYLINGKKPYHICAENNDLRRHAIEWPLSSSDLNITLPVSNISFIKEQPTILINNQETTWDFKEWHRTLSAYSGVRLPSNPVREVPGSYDRYNRLAAHGVASCLDIDIIEKVNDSSIGIEATHLFKEMYSEQEAKRLFSFILTKRLLLAEAHQLITQLNCMKLLGGKLYLLTYNTENDRLKENGNVLLLNIDDNVAELINSGSAQEILSRLKFGKFADIYAEITGHG